MRSILLFLLCGVTVAGCRCGPNVQSVAPSLGVAPAAIDFEQVKNGETVTRTLQLKAQTQAAVQISSITIESGSAPGGAEAFGVTPAMAPVTVDALGTLNLSVRFSPTVLQEYQATLVLQSNDTDRPTVRVPLIGVGAKPIMSVTPECSPTRQCVGTVVVDPPSIDFGGEPFVRLMPVDPSKLPAVVVVNEGPVALTVTKLSVEGADAAAFQIQGNAMLPAGGQVIEPAAGFNIPVRFKPTSEGQNSYSATLVIEGDDVEHPSGSVALTGTLRPNLPPVVCANLIKVKPPLDSERDYSQRAEWDKLLLVPAGGYDFSITREVEPGSEYVIFSAISDSANESACTADPEDGRQQLTYAWAFVSGPPGVTFPAIATPFVGGARFAPGKVTGTYKMSLTVSDAQGHMVVVPITFAVAVKQDLVAQVQWPGFSGVDLDIHLVRPTAATAPTDPFSGTFEPFQAGAAGKTSGDINGWAALTLKNNPAAGYDFNWGGPSTADDPRLNIDDTGDGTLVENVSLNFPENDALCATSRCHYKVLVHYFKDARTGDQGPCFFDGGTGCTDGDQCSCALADRCVSSGLDAGVGSGRCIAAPKPVVRIFLKGSPTAAKVIPLDTLMPPDEVALGSPCKTFYAADIEWPAKSEIGSLPDGGTPLGVVTAPGEEDGGMGRLVTPFFATYGRRPTGEIRACTPDTTVGGRLWYSKQ